MVRQNKSFSRFRLRLVAGLIVATAMTSWGQVNLKMTPPEVPNEPKPEIFDHVRMLNAIAKNLADEDMYNEAISAQTRALYILDKVGEPGRFWKSRNLDDLGLLYYSKGDYKEAAKAFAAAREYEDRIFKSDNWGDYVNPAVLYMALMYQAKGDHRSALQYAAGSNQTNDYSLGYQFHSSEEAQKLRIMKNIARETDITISLERESSHKNPALTVLAMNNLLHRKGRILDSVSETLSRVRRNPTKENQLLLDRHQKTLSKCATLAFRSASKTIDSAGQSALNACDADIKEIEDDLFSRVSDFYLKWKPEKFEDIQSAIPSESALIEIARYKPFNFKAVKNRDRWRAPRYVAYVLRAQGKPQGIDLGDAKTIDGALTDLLDKTSDDNSSEDEIKRASHQLYLQLMTRILPATGKTKYLIVSPDGLLSLLPFGILMNPADNKYLIEDYHFRYLSSGRDLLRLRESAEKRQGPVVLAYPSFQDDGSGSDLTAADILCGGNVTVPKTGEEFGVQNPLPEAKSQNRRSSLISSNFNSESIAFTHDEAKTLCGILNQPQVVIKSGATEAFLKSVKGPSILHIATHGFFKGAPFGETLESTLTIWSDLADWSAIEDKTIVENPLLRSGLALAGANLRKSVGDEDGLLTALEVSGLDLWGTKLVVLSACDTGLGDVRNGEGIYGLRRALVIAGAESQVISLWSVNDKATRDLIVSYYRRLQAGAGRADALRDAQIEMLKGDDMRTRHPHFWAAFVESGAWGPMDKSEFASAK